MEEKATLADVFDFSFTKFVTPIVVKIAFIVMLVLGGLIWLTMIIGGFASSFGSTSVCRRRRSRRANCLNFAEKKPCSK